MAGATRSTRWLARVALVIAAMVVWTHGRRIARVSRAVADEAARSRAAPASARSASGRLAVHFFDVGQGLAALVVLPDGRHLLVDGGDAPDRAGCAECGPEHEHLLAALGRDVGTGALDLVWIPHYRPDA